MLKLLGPAESVKFGGGVTVRLMAVVWVKAPEVPWTVTVTGPPVVAEALAVSVRTHVLVGLVVLVGLNDAVTPMGRVEVTDRLTLPEKPFVGFTVIVLVPLVPWAMLKVVGAAVSVKFGGGVTVRLRVVVLVKAPEVPWTVTVTGPPVVA